MKLLIMTLLLALAACAPVPYVPRNDMHGGYSETQLDERTFAVRFTGNHVTSDEQAEDFVLLRSADVRFAFSASRSAAFRICHAASWSPRSDSRKALSISALMRTATSGFTFGTIIPPPAEVEARSARGPSRTGGAAGRG
jgi:hypothetical protein